MEEDRRKSGRSAEEGDGDEREKDEQLRTCFHKQIFIQLIFFSVREGRKTWHNK